MSKLRTGLEDYLVYGIDEKHRRVFFGTSLVYHSDEYDIGGFTQCSCEFAIRAIARMESSSPKTPIEIHMNSYGGDPYAMLGLYDTIQSTTCQIKFYGKGAIMSAATWIMCGSDERYLYPNTRIMVHNGWTGSLDGKVTDAEIAMEENKFLQNKLEFIYEDNSKMPYEFWHEVCKRDLFMSSEEAIQLGLADKIIQPKKRGNFRKIRQASLSKRLSEEELIELTSKLLSRIQTTSKVEIIMKPPKEEPIDASLTIEPLVEVIK